MMNKFDVRYYAIFREERGVNQEVIKTNTRTAKELYKELQSKYHFKLSMDSIRVAVNDEFVRWDKPLKSGDKIIFIPPVAGG